MAQRYCNRCGEMMEDTEEKALGRMEEEAKRDYVANNIDNIFLV